MAVDAHGNALAQAAAGSASWSATPIAGGASIEGVSCPAASLCVAVDASGAVLWSTDARSGHWNSATIDAGHTPRAVSCASTSLCVAVDADGRALASTDPTGGAGAWRVQTIDFSELDAVSCAASECVAVDGGGQALASADPGAPGATWSLTPIDLEPITAVSCARSGLCVAVGAGGRALASDEPAAAAPAWSSAAAGGGSLSGVSCTAGGLCVAVDGQGRSVSARPPAPAVATFAPAQVTAASAVLAGSVDPRDASLLSCAFQYGTSPAYGGSVPCGSAPAAAGGAHPVSASVTGLEPNRTYHFRAVAESPSGAAAGADATFKTAVSPLVARVRPHPSITGTPAAGQTLTCRAGTPAGASAALSYAWLRDLVPVAGSTEPAYRVKGRDRGHHIQCAVTATNGGGSETARSAFVTVPAGGVPRAAGETLVGLASYRAGRVALPVACSRRASRGCELTAKLTALATPAGRHPQRHGVLLGATRARLPAGAHRTVVLRLGATGRRLLASRRTLSAALVVSGTVIGVIRARLADQLFVLRGGRPARAAEIARGRSAPAHATRRRAGAPGAAGLAATPYMGWDTYLALGGRYSESTVLEEASRLLTLGLRNRGYRYVWLDVGWWQGSRGASGEIEVSAAQWPHGLRWLTGTLHAAGFLVGLYTDAGPNGCGGAGQGSYGHYQQDADAFAAWGFDAVKVDFCGGSEHQLPPAAAYTEFHAALAANSGHRPMLLSICNFLVPGAGGGGASTVAGSAFGSYSFGPGVGNSWRTDTDVGAPHHVLFANVLRNMDADAADPEAAGPGHWNDPDYLAPDQGMNPAQFRTQLSMWSMLAAPLMVSDDLRKIRRSSLRTLLDREVLAIDQDPAGVQGRLVSASGNGEVWVKPLAGGSRAVALLNRGSGAITVRTSAAAVGLPPATRYTVRDLWRGSTSASAGPLAARVPAFSTVLLRVSG